MDVLNLSCLKDKQVKMLSRKLDFLGEHKDMTQALEETLATHRSCLWG